MHLFRRGQPGSGRRVPARGTLGPVADNFLINFLFFLAIATAFALLARTPRDRQARMEKGRSIGLPWSGSCVAVRSVDVVVPLDRILDLSAEAMVAVHGSSVTVDSMAWSVHGWTGTRLGSYGWQLTIVITQTGTGALRLTCIVRPRCALVQIGLGAPERKADRLVRALQRSSSAGLAPVGSQAVR